MRFMFIQLGGVIRKQVSAKLSFEKSSWNLRAISIELWIKIVWKYKPTGLVKRVCTNLVKLYGRRTYESNGILLGNIFNADLFHSPKVLINSHFWLLYNLVYSLLYSCFILDFHLSYSYHMVHFPVWIIFPFRWWFPPALFAIELFVSPTTL